MKTGTIAAETGQGPEYLVALAECLKEMAGIRKKMKRREAEIRRLENSTRRKQEETQAIIRRVQATF